MKRIVIIPSIAFTSSITVNAQDITQRGHDTVPTLADSTRLMKKNTGKMPTEKRRTGRLDGKNA